MIILPLDRINRITTGMWRCDHMYAEVPSHPFQRSQITRRCAHTATFSVMYRRADGDDVLTMSCGLHVDL